MRLMCCSPPLSLGWSSDFWISLPGCDSCLYPPVQMNLSVSPFGQLRCNCGPMFPPALSFPCVLAVGDLAFPLCHIFIWLCLFRLPQALGVRRAAPPGSLVTSLVSVNAGNWLFWPYSTYTLKEILHWCIPNCH